MAAMTKPPIPLRTAIDVAALCQNDPCDEVVTLGSFWPNSLTSYESKLVKAFKFCTVTADFEPHITALCRFYCAQVIRLAGANFDWVLRALGSQEMSAERSRPQSALADMICAKTGARNVENMFFRSSARPPMRAVSRLGGPDALKARVQYVVQDLFARPQKLSGRVLLLDDISNTGATTRVYAYMLKEYAQVKSVCAVNLAATRFANGKDGHGALKLDTSELTETALSEVWTCEGVFHTLRDCPDAAGRLTCEVRFMAERQLAPCPTCAEHNAPTRRWWQFGRPG